MDDPNNNLQGKAAEFARILRERVPELRERYGVESLGIFGSYVRGEQSEDSDLDLLVEYKRPMGLFKFASLRRYISEILGVDVDLVPRGALKKSIGQNILREVVPVWPVRP